MQPLTKRYNPKEVEDKWYSFWESEGLFRAHADSGNKPYVIVIPPPNITGILTMGHVLNNTLQDILVRWKRMQGFEVLWLPGTDHAGIATQNVVEKELARQGIDKEELGRDGFVQKVWEWREEYGGTIIRQLKKLGCSCDWSRERFTMDEGLSRAVREVFVQLYEKGLVYRGNYIINWCPRCRTALSDEEVEHEEHQGHLWHIRYPFKDGSGHITVATTRPETMLGDTAVAVHPDDERYRALIGKTLLLPVIGREIHIIADSFVDPAFGTGLVKVTPAHDPNDFQLGQRHDLPQVVVMDVTGVMNDNAGEAYAGMDRFECREALVAHLEELKLIEKIESHTHAVGHCYRCRSVIEPYVSKQWFVRMKSLAAPALDAVLKGDITFYPDRWVKVYENWMRNIRDWCVSRQLWWGHRIPVWYCGDCGKEIVAQETPSLCPACDGTALTQDEDVLDTWFSSWLWPFSTLGWPDETDDLAFFYPTSTLVTGPDIIFFWVARMIMAGFEFMGEIPFRDVFFTGIIRDGQGRKMSKSLGNSPDPLDVIEQYGADALRFTIARLSPIGQDVYYSNENCELGRNFANKIWNASRFVLMNMGESPPGEDPGFSYTLDDRYILSALNNAVAEVTAALEGYHFNEAAQKLYEFFWNHYCDWYIELVKPLLKDTASEDARRSHYVLIRCLDTFLRLLYPLMPFLAEEIWQMLPLGAEKGDSLTAAAWPPPLPEWHDPGAVEQAEKKFGLIRTVRSIRKECGVPLKEKIPVVVKPVTEEEKEALETARDTCCRLMQAKELRIDEGFTPAHPMPAGMTASGTVVYLDMRGSDFVEGEIARLRKEIEALEKQIEAGKRQLENKEFVKKAPEHVVQRQRDRLDNLIQRLKKTRKNCAMLEAHQ